MVSCQGVSFRIVATNETELAFRFCNVLFQVSPKEFIRELIFNVQQRSLLLKIL